MIAIIKSCGSNLTSIQFALNRLGKKSIVTDDENTIKNASHVILPGVGHANKTMQRIKSLGLDTVIRTLTQPVLGICLGMQLLYEHSEEGQVDCLGIIPGKIRKFIDKNNYALPHMGWNSIDFVQQRELSALREAQKSYAYFVHSYVAPVNEFTIATTEYTEKFTAIVQYKNFMGMQFHPEKSGEFGENLLNNFIEMS